MESIRCGRTEVCPFPVLDTTSTPPQPSQLYCKSQVSGFICLFPICGLINDYSRTSGYMTLNDDMINELWIARKPSWPNFRYYSNIFLDQLWTMAEKLAVFGIYCRILIGLPYVIIKLCKFCSLLFQSFHTAELCTEWNVKMWKHEILLQTETVQIAGHIWLRSFCSSILYISQKKNS